MSRLPPEVLARLEAPDLDQDEELALIWPGYFPRDSAIPALIAGMAVSAEANEAGQAAMVAQSDLADRLRGSAVPMLFVVGDGSPIPVTASTDTAALVGDAVLATAGRGHFPWLTAPGSVRAAVDRFLTDASSHGS